MKRGAAAVLAAILLLGLTACGDESVASIERNAKLKQACEKAGGALYNAAPGWRCNLSTKEKP